MNIPNILTIIRILLVPTYLAIFFSDLKQRVVISVGIFILAGITDFLDGYIARKYNLITKLGKVLDPLADKLMMFAVLISLVSIKLIPKWVMIILVGKEILMILGGSILYIFKGNQVLPSNVFGKIATVFFYVATMVTIFKPKTILSKNLFIITIILNIVAFINYFLIFVSMSKEK